METKAEIADKVSNWIILSNIRNIFDWSNEVKHNFIIVNSEGRLLQERKIPQSESSHIFEERKFHWKIKQQLWRYQFLVSIEATKAICLKHQ